MKRTLFALALTASLALPAAAPAATTVSHVRLLSDHVVTVAGVRHVRDTWRLSGHLVLTDATETALPGGGVEQMLAVSRDGKLLASVRARYTPANGWKAAPQAIFADGRRRVLEPIAYRPLRALGIAEANARFASRAWADAHPRMQAASRRPQAVAQIAPILDCGAVCSAVTDGLGWGAYVICFLACISGG